MAELYRFFDSTVDDLREYKADEFAEYFRQLLTDGVFNGGTNLKVTADDATMTTTIQDGFAWLQGYLYKVQGTHQLTHETADPTNDRIDRVIVRWDKRDDYRYIKAFILQGAPGVNPQPPTLTRSADVVEISLAQVRIRAGVSVITATDITDERLNTNVCGLVNSLIQADTTEIFNKFNAWYDTKTAEFQQQWNDWFNLTTADYSGDWSTWFTNTQNEWDTWYAQQFSESNILESQRNQPGGFLGLNTEGKADLQQLPALDYVPLSEKAKPNGVATLGADGLVPVNQLPQWTWGSVSRTVALSGYRNATPDPYEWEIFTTSFTVPTGTKELIVDIGYASLTAHMFSGINKIFLTSGSGKNVEDVNRGYPSSGKFQGEADYPGVERISPVMLFDIYLSGNTVYMKWGSYEVQTLNLTIKYMSRR